MPGVPNLDDLWPQSLGHSDLVPPIRILRIQAEALETRTGGVLKGRVVSHSLKGTIHHTFYIVAPALKNYEYRLFRVEHPVVLYPLSVVVNGVEKSASDEAAFVETIKGILSSERTLRVVRALFAQSNEPDTFVSEEEDDDGLPF